MRRHVAALRVARMELGAGFAWWAGLVPARAGPVLELPREAVLLRRLVLPRAAVRRMRQALPFLIEQETPFRAGDVVAGWRVQGATEAGAGGVEVELAVAPVGVMQLVEAAAAGIGVAGVAGLRLTEGPSGTLRLGRRQGGGAWRWLAGAASVLTLGGAPMVALVLAMRVASLPGADGANAAELGRLTVVARRLRAVAPALPAGALLQRLAVAVPDGTWLTSLDASGHTVELAGRSADMAGLVARLQSMPGVAGLEFRAPVLHEADGRDRFDVAVRVP